MIPSTTKLVLLYTLLYIVADAFPMPKRYYQSQEGDINVRADIKDIGIILLPDKGMVDSAVNIVVFGTTKGGSRQIGADRVKSKYGYVRPEKSPYKVDLEKSTVPLVKVDNVPETKQVGDAAKEHLIDFDKKTVKKDLKPTGEESETLEIVIVEKKKETDEKKDVKKEMLNKEKDMDKDMKKEVLNKDKDLEKDMKKEVLHKVKDMEKDMKKEVLNKDKDMEKDMKKGEVLPKDEKDKDKAEATTRQKGMKMQGEKETLILIHEGIEDCGPDGDRNKEGICVFSPLT